MIVMSGVKEKILQFASECESFGKAELYAFLNKGSNVSLNTVSCFLTQLVKDRKLSRVSRGYYALAYDTGMAFEAELGEEGKVISRVLMDRFPYASFCIYNGRSLAALQHHLSENNVTYIECERYIMESVFDCLRSRGYVVWLNPDGNFIYNYIDLKRPSFIIKPLVTEAPTVLLDGIKVPTLEKLMVDIEKDACFQYLRGAESKRMWDNAFELYQVNRSRLYRYAKRRGLDVER